MTLGDARAVVILARLLRMTPAVLQCGCPGRFVSYSLSLSLYRSDRTKTWLKAKNPDSPAMTRGW